MARRGDQQAGGQRPAGEYGRPVWPSAPFEKTCIANRGEIAFAYNAPARSWLGRWAVLSEADREGLHVRFADQGRVQSARQEPKSYLDFHR